ncbi:hypothetical protein [Methanobacterium spitsbergense]|uniref:Uncharacterized protein n=1 Tax=Methanobacterium spitsbergense TaxID=2874285 RepID=A0A8T5UVV6_9EURY|nr:hypothetical protein [Methanobacterium spitsbergense]MBZ2166387.1 hypothetical protein [Methanobacterium spitsbergense]
MNDKLFRGKTGKGLRSDVFQWFLRKLNIECEWGFIGRQIFFHSNILRKIFDNNLEESGMPHHYIRQLMGHRKDPLQGTIFLLQAKNYEKNTINSYTILILLNKLNFKEI